MLKTTAYILFCLLVLVACQHEETQRKENSSFQMADVEFIRQHGQLVEWAINHNRLDSLMKDFWQSDSAYFMANGRMLKGYEAIYKSFQRDRSGLSIKLTEAQAVLLSPDIGIHLAKFDQTNTDSIGKEKHFKGVWSAHYKKIDGKWKVIGVHESLRPYSK